MSAPIGPGDWVEFYKLWRGVPVPEWCPLRLGATYQVRDLFDTDNFDGTSEPGCTLVGVYCVPPGGMREGAFPLQCFRPSRPPNIEVLKSYLQPSPTRELEDA